MGDDGGRGGEGGVRARPGRQIWIGRRRLLALGRPRLLLLAVAALGGAVVVAWSVGRDAGMWWLCGAGLVAGAQLVAAIVATEERVRPREGTAQAGGTSGR